MKRQPVCGGRKWSGKPLILLTLALGIAGGAQNALAWTDPYYANTVLWYQFSNTNEPTDDSSYLGTNPGNLAAGGAKPTWTDPTNSISASYYFDGGDYISAADADSLSFGTGTADTPFSISVWVRVEKWTNGALIAKYTSSPAGEYMLTVLGGGLLQFSLRDASASATLYLMANIVQGRTCCWQNITGTYNGNGSTNGMALYLNGRQPPGTISMYKSASYVAMENGTQQVTVGVHALNEPANRRYAKGMIDDVRIYSTNLSAAAAQTLFWNIATNYDYSLYDLNNLSEWSNTVFIGNFGYDFPADTSYVSVNHGNKGAGGACPTFLSDAENGWYYFVGGDTITLTITNNKAAYAWWGKTNEAWQHYAELNGTQYVDAAQGSFSNTFFYTSGNTVTLGKNATTYLDGHMDEFRIYSAFTAASLTNLFNGTKARFKERGSGFEF